MVRGFPFRSAHNIGLNLRHYKTCFISRHSFSTTTHLQNASYTYWLKESSKDTNKNEQISDSRSEFSPKLHPALFKPGRDDSVHAAEQEVFQLFQLGDFQKIYKKLKEYKNKEIFVSTEVINNIFAGVTYEIPEDTSSEHLHQSELETPALQGKDDLRFAAAYSGLYPHIQNLYDICKLYETTSSGNQEFLENYIWLCYHTDDLTTLQQLLYAYLKCPAYNSRTLSYAINAFVLNYDVEFAKNLFQSVVGMNKPLESILLSSTLANFVKVGAIFDNTLALFKTWTAAPNCEQAHPKTVALLLKQHYKYGLPKETALMEEVSKRLGYSQHFLVSMVKNQSAIINRNLHHKKQITSDDITQALETRNTILFSKLALTIFYESYLLFVSRYSSMEMIQFILQEMQNDNIPISEFAYNVIIQHYVSERKFFPLLEFVQKSISTSKPFEAIYIKHMFDAFVRTYPYEGEHFAQKFHEWLQANSNLSPVEKDRLAQSCRITKLESSVTPFAIERNALENSKKYESSEWRKISHNPNFPNKAKAKEQVNFRMNKGLRDIMRKGIKPDYFFLENTLRRLKYSYRVNILEMLGDLRMDKYKTRLEILHMILAKPNKVQLELFVRQMDGSLNSSDKIFLARRLINYNLYDTAARLLESVDANEVGRAMIKLNLSLRNEVCRNNFSGCDVAIEAFPINAVTLSPYIYKQCRFIEKNLENKIRVLEAKLQGNVDEMRVTLGKLRGLIGDIDARLQQDKSDISEKLQEMFKMLDTWMKDVDL